MIDNAHIVVSWINIFSLIFLWLSWAFPAVRIFWGIFRYDRVGKPFWGASELVDYNFKDFSSASHRTNLKNPSFCDFVISRNKYQFSTDCREKRISTEQFWVFVGWENFSNEIISLLKNVKNFFFHSKKLAFPVNFPQPMKNSRLGLNLFPMLSMCCGHFRWTLFYFSSSHV